MSQSLSPETVAIVKATEPALAQYGEAISLRMYERLFQDEAVRALFKRPTRARTAPRSRHWRQRCWRMRETSMPWRRWGRWWSG